LGAGSKCEVAEIPRFAGISTWPVHRAQDEKDVD
jgi:hypothetical protein